MAKKQVDKKKADSALLSYEEYCATLKLALKIRKEHLMEIQKAITPQAKTELQKKLFAEYNILGSASSVPKEREQAVVLKVNVFLPNTKQFVSDYQTRFDKNIRLISEHYQVPAPFVISKISEIGRYEKYLERIQKEGGLGDIKETSISPNEETKPISEKVNPKITSSKESIEIQKEVPTMLGQQMSAESEQLMKHIGSMQIYCSKLLDSNNELASENEELSKENKELKQTVKTLEALIQQLQKENADLQDRSSVGFESHIESSLRKQVKDLECTNKELLEALSTQTARAKEYRNRAVVAEAQLDQFQAGMQGIVQEVDSIDLSLFQDYTSSGSKGMSA